MAYIGSVPQIGTNKKLDALTFNGSTTTFTLTSSGAAVYPVISEAVLISLDGVLQEPGNAYTVSGSSIIFNPAPATGTSFFGVLLGERVAISGALQSSSPSYTGGLIGDTGVVNIGSGQFYKDTAGNIGVNTVPSAWNIGWKVVDVGSGGASFIGQAGATAVVNNAYLDSGSVWRYKITSGSGLYSLGTTGDHSWWTSPSGTAGTVATFTRRMLLTDTGVLTVTKTSGDTTIRSTSGSTSAQMISYDTGFTYITGLASVNCIIGNQSNGPVSLVTNNLERIQIDAAGKVGIGVTPVTKFDVSGSQSCNIVDVAAGTNIDLSLGNYFIKTVSGAITFTVSGTPASRAYAFTIEVTHTAGAITWFAGVQWPGNTAPTLTTGKVHLFTFVTDNGGSTWRAASNINYAA